MSTEDVPKIENKPKEEGGKDQDLITDTAELMGDWRRQCDQGHPWSTNGGTVTECPKCAQLKSK